MKRLIKYNKKYFDIYRSFVLMNISSPQFAFFVCFLGTTACISQQMKYLNASFCTCLRKKFSDE